jgi:hypothetical protein
MDFSGAISRPFSDLKKLSIGAALYMVPVLALIPLLILIVPVAGMVAGMFAYGYVLACGATAMKKVKKLPEWTNWADLFVKGLVAVIIAIIYFIPAIVILGLVVGTTILASLTVDNLAAVIGSAGLGAIIALLAGMLTAYVLPVALLMYVSENKFGSAFRLGDVFKKAFTGTYFAAWLLSIVVGIVINIVSMTLSIVLALTVVLPIVIAGYATITSGVIGMTLLGEAVGSK